ncbi:MAG: hypothetical protein KJ957_06175 [Candidatus Omnitrophica bacterium]|nr:hypothetical protein [Candidatus Omnitrophota bacterium]
MCDRKRNKTSQRLVKVLYVFLGGVIIVLVTNLVLIDKPFEANSIIVIDSTDWRHGKNSLKWDFKIQSERKYLFNRGILMGCFAHLEVCPDSEGNLQGIDLRKFKGLKFFIKGSSEFLSVNEFNLFMGPNYIQYRYVKAPIAISTKWQEVYIDFKDFILASWDKKYRGDLVPKEPYLSDITAFGLDIKARFLCRYGKIWIDYIRIVGYDNKETLITDCEDMASLFLEKTVRWKSDWREYGKWSQIK